MRPLMTVVYDATKLGTLPSTAQLVPSREVVKGPADESKVITSPDFPATALRLITRTAACDLEIATEEIETKSAEVRSSTINREPNARVNTRHAVMMSRVWNI